jgi:hypothetical protein
MTVTKNHVGRFTRKLYRFLDEGHDFKFRKMPHRRGQIYIDYKPTEIHLDHRDPILPTLIHEALHYFYPQASETWVLTMERKIVNQLSDRQVRNILRRWAQNI